MVDSCLRVSNDVNVGIIFKSAMENRVEYLSYYGSASTLEDPISS